MQRLDPQDKSLVSNFACKVPQTISTVMAEFEVASVAMKVTVKKSFLELRTSILGISPLRIIIILGRLIVPRGLCS